MITVAWNIDLIIGNKKEIFTYRQRKFHSNKRNDESIKKNEPGLSTQAASVR